MEMITKEDVENYIVLGAAYPSEVAFMIQLDQWALANIEDEDCLMLWWDKTGEIVGCKKDYDYEAAIECLRESELIMQSINIRCNTIH